MIAQVWEEWKAMVKWARRLENVQYTSYIHVYMHVVYSISDQPKLFAYAMYVVRQNMYQFRGANQPILIAQCQPKCFEK